MSDRFQEGSHGPLFIINIYYLDFCGNILLMKDNYKATIGLEIHAELKTNSKMFCSCKNDPDEEKPNVNVCPVCMGHPGTLPVLNKEAIKHVLKIGLAVGGKIADFTEWDRKNYFYPDIPKGYQISQYKYPLISGGSIDGLELTRIHLEEDTAKSTHDTGAKSLVDFNRSGVPLMELVTEPVIHTAEEAVLFAKDLQRLLRYLGAGDANMEKGEMRVEANISVSKTEKFGTKTEVKNLNSFKVVEKAINFEIARQIELLEEGGQVKQETRGWDEAKGETYSQRSKESAHDYRYFPEPDLPKLMISQIPEFATDKLRSEIVELPWERRERMKKTYGVTDTEAEMFVDSSVLTNYFESIIKKLSSEKNSQKLSKLALNYLISDYLGIIKKSITVAGAGDEQIYSSLSKVSVDNFADLMKMIDENLLSSRGAKDVLKLMFDNAEKGVEPRKIAEENNLIQKNDAGALEVAVKKVIDANPKQFGELKSGKEALLQFFIGMTMKETKGSANPEMVKEIIKKFLV